MAETVQAGKERKVPPAGGAGGGANGGTAGGMAGGLAQKALAMGSALRERLTAMPPARRNAFIASVCVVAALCAGMVWFAQRPNWKTLFSGLEGKDMQQVSQELAAAGIPYQASADGTRDRGSGGDGRQGADGGGGEGHAADRAAGIRALRQAELGGQRVR